MFKDQINIAQDWVNKRTNKERFILLFVGCFCVYLLWYLMLARPLAITRMHLSQQRTNLLMQASVFDKEAHSILQDAVDSNHLAPNEQPENLILTLSSPENADQVINAVLQAQQNIKLSSLKSVLPTATDADKYNFRIDFQSNYFDALDYLDRLEKLPWCLSWDSLEYKVTQYPEAAVVVSLHIVSV